MAKYLIRWNAGYGDDYAVYEADDDDAANMLAYEQWKEDVESNANYSAELLTRELALDHDLLHEIDEEE